MNPLMVMLVRNTRKLIREGCDEIDMNAPFVAIFDLSQQAMASRHEITAAHFMAATAHIGDIW